MVHRLSDLHRLFIYGFLGSLIVCSGTTDRMNVEYQSLVFQGKTRDYIVFTPHHQSNAMPLIINLHGYGSSAEEQMAYTGMNAVADTAGFIVVYPDAVGRRWNSGIGDNPSWPTPDVDDVGFIDALIEALGERYEIDSTRVYACGMSNGGFMSCKLACELSHKIRAAASVTGIISTGTVSSCSPHKAIPMLFMFGTQDPTVPYLGTAGWHSAEETVRHFSALNSCSVSDTVFMTDRDPKDESTATRITCEDSTGNKRVVFYKIVGGGHTWPGAVFALRGNTNRDINASEIICRFFSEN